MLDNTSPLCYNTFVPRKVVDSTNIFLLDKDLELNAQYMVDRHIVKMPTDIRLARHIYTVGKIEIDQNGCDKVYELEPDERECYRCGTCAYFKVNADMPNVESTCKRIDHKNVQFYRPWFKSYDCNQFSGTICSDFIPADWCIAAKKNWDGFENYWKSYKKYWNTRTDSAGCSFFLDRNTDVGYRVKLTDFVFGTMYNEDGTLKAYEKFYQKQSRKSPTGWNLITEKL